MKYKEINLSLSSKKQENCIFVLTIIWEQCYYKIIRKMILSEV